MSITRAGLFVAVLACGGIGLMPEVMSPRSAFAQPAIVITADVAPPPLPVYLQPPVPGSGYLWAPGYWAWEPAAGYYWVPGTWVLPPRPNLLWTPAYWGWDNGVYLFHRGYWDTQVGFYGGVAYGFGYTGSGYYGGYWNGGAFFYNRAVTNITNVSVTNVYNQTVVINAPRSSPSFNGGAGGTTARPTPQQVAEAQAPHEPPTAAQTQHVGAARANPALRLSANGGVPPIAATPHPHAFGEPGTVAASPSGHPAPSGGAAIHTPAAAGAANALPSTALPAQARLPGHAGPIPDSAHQTPAIAGRPGPAGGGADLPRAAPQAPRPTMAPVGLAGPVPHAAEPRAMAPRPMPQAAPSFAPRQMAMPRMMPQHSAPPRMAAPRMMAPRMAAPRMAAPHMAAPRMAMAAPRRGPSRPGPRGHH